MEATVKVTVELGEKTTALLSTILGGIKPVAQAKTEGPVPNKKEEPKTEKPAKKESAASFEDLDDDAKLEAIKTEVTKHTKKGKSADIKALLTAFDAGRASELATDRYDEFYTAIVRYGKGESVQAITGGGDDDLN